MSRIYLEATPAFPNVNLGNYLHMYLVRRNDPVSTEQFYDLDWRNTGDVIRGGPQATVEVPVYGTADGTEVKPLTDSSDAYTSQDDITSRIIVDITDKVDPANWEALQQFALGIEASGYGWEAPIISGPFDHVSNSNDVHTLIAEFSWGGCS